MFKNNKGDLNAGLAVFVIMLALMITGTTLDVAKVQWQKFIVNNQLTFVGRIAAKQGGIKNSPPKDYDTNLVYNTTSDVYSAVERALSTAHIYDFKISVGGRYLPSASGDYDFQMEIPIKMQATFKNSFVSRMFGGSEYVTIGDSIVVISEKWNRNNTTIH